MHTNLFSFCIVLLYLSFFVVTQAFIPSVNSPSSSLSYSSAPLFQKNRLCNGSNRYDSIKLFNKQPQRGSGFGSSSAKNSALNTGKKSKQQKVSSNGSAPQQNQTLPPKFQMAYTCNRCDTRNLITIDREAYTNGIVIAVCKGCQSKHLVADNEKKLDFGGAQEHYRNIEELLAAKGRGDEIQRVNMNDINSSENSNSKLEDMDLEYNEKDGVVTLKPHVLEQNRKIKDAVMKHLKEEEEKEGMEIDQDDEDGQS